MGGDGGARGAGRLGSGDPDLAAAGIAPPQMVAGYRAGAFPMDILGADGPVGWYTADPRWVIPMPDARIPATVRRMLRRRRYEVRMDTAFRDVLTRCGGDRGGVWLTPRLMNGYEALFARGIAYSVEAWQGNVLVGGLFGVRMGRVLTAESMFHRAPDGGNAAIAGLIGIARAEGATLVDVQMESPHLARFGARGMPHDEFTGHLVRTRDLG